MQVQGFVELIIVGNSGVYLVYPIRKSSYYLELWDSCLQPL